MSNQVNSSTPESSAHALTGPPDLVSAEIPRHLQPKHPLWGARLETIIQREGEITRDVLALNRGLKRAWELGDPVCWIMARVRCEILRLTPGKYAALMQASSDHAIIQLECRARSKNDSQLFTDILKKWDSISKSVENPDVSAALSEAREELLKALVKKQGRGVYSLFRRWRYEVGGEEFDKASRVSYQAMWSRVKKGTQSTFSDVIELAQKINFLPADLSAAQMWRHPLVRTALRHSMRDGKKLDRPQPVIELHAMLACCGHRIGATSLHNNPVCANAKVAQRTALDLFNFQMPEWHRVEPVFKLFVQEGLLKERQLVTKEALWETARLQLPQRFESRISEIAVERGLDNGHLADVFGLRTLNPAKPALAIFRALNYGEYAAPVSAGVLASLIGRSRDEIDQLLELKRQDISSDLKRKSSSLNPQLVAERRLWNLSYKDLPLPKDQIQQLEWGKEVDTAKQATLLSTIREVGDRQTRGALTTLIRLNDFTSVSSAMSALIDRNGLAPLAQQIQSSAYTVGRIARGEEVPSLPLLRSFLDSKQVPLTFALRLDWQDSFARHIAGEEHGDLNRVLTGLIGLESTSRRDLFEARGLRYQATSRPLKLLSALGTISEPHLLSLLEKIGIEPETPRHRFVMQVYRHGSIAVGLDAWLEELKSSGQKQLTSQFRALSTFIKEESEKAGLDTKLQPVDILVRQAGLISRISGKEVLSVDIDAGQEVKFTELLDMLPGVTRAELLAAGDAGASARLRSSYAASIAAIEASGIDRKSLVAMAAGMAPVAALSNGYIKLAIDGGLASAAFSAGIAAIFSTPDPGEFINKIHRLRVDTVKAFQELGIDANALTLEMKVWGVRPQDLAIDRRQLQAAMWSTDGDPVIRSEVLGNILSIIKIRVQQAFNADDRRQRQSDALQGWVRGKLNHVDACLSVISSTDIVKLVSEIKTDIERVRRETAEAKKEREREQQSEQAGESRVATPRVQRTTQWTMQAHERFLPLDQKLALLSDHLLNQEVVSNAQLKMLFPQFHTLLDSLARQLETTGRQAQLAWYVASIIFFEDPEEALNRMDQLLKDGSVSKYPGEMHYRNLREFHATLTSRRALSSASMGLYFGEYSYVAG